MSEAAVVESNNKTSALRPDNNFIAVNWFRAKENLFCRGFFMQNKLDTYTDLILSALEGKIE
jgi:hypothetical protein